MTGSGNEREALKILRRLANPRAHHLDEQQLPAAEAVIRRGLAERRGGRIVLTDLGRASLRRHLVGADGFAAQHQARSEIIVDSPEIGRQSATVNLDESPLMRLRRMKGRDGRPIIDDAEFVAGERLRSDFTRARMTPRVTANWTASVSDKRRDGGAGGLAEFSDATIAARQRVERALDAAGPDFAGVLMDFCCFLKGVEEIERDRAWPARSAKLVVRLALSCLARHYGLAAAARGAEAAGRLRHWGAEDYRPVVD